MAAVVAAVLLEDVTFVVDVVDDFTILNNIFGLDNAAAANFGSRLTNGGRPLPHFGGDDNADDEVDDDDGDDDDDDDIDSILIGGINAKPAIPSDLAESINESIRSVGTTSSPL
ncbi:hypothetical protein DERP_008028 [Dermatophagoides pteronyssinus]|uniref:Uncharacterized protein n=1 Tax=Dermatophagoides pteronyssinus TaxID=6956 RepID=A0ABQ8IU09_DERPT|nr:hypothetical protein DERP_008028 [Dermatophagoides pteronyssinus]